VIASLSEPLAYGSRHRTVGRPIRSPFQSRTAKPGFTSSTAVRMTRAALSALSIFTSLAALWLGAHDDRPALRHNAPVASPGPAGEISPAPNFRQHSCHFCLMTPSSGSVQQTKGGDPMSSGFGFRNVARADCPFGKQPS